MLTDMDLEKSKFWEILTSKNLQKDKNWLFIDK